MTRPGGVLSKMMKNNAIHAAPYVFRADEQILVDANVWLYLQPPAAQPAPSWANRGYSRVFANLLAAGAVPVIDALILSEYLNRYVRIEYDACWKEGYSKFKDFRSSPAGVNVTENAVAEAEHILSFTGRLQDTMANEISLSDVFAEFKQGSIDFNDGILIENCRLRQWKFLTHDADIRVGGIDVLTLNKKLLGA